MTVKAMDKDSGENGRVTYHFKVDEHNVQETDDFVIDADTGELKSKKYLDREEKDKYEVSFYLVSLVARKLIKNKLKLLKCARFKIFIFPACFGS